ncbi:hypothetical protein [Calditerricola satsumensis]|uniref:hypothetical protein n=1 Tax=Calditerricola satsumensis TaxID=373054 RepID=UPI0012ECDEF5|nr:hypothetical protein [Calditerricola satsumensis]
MARLYYVTLPASAAEASRRRVFTDPDEALAATVSGEGYAHVAAPPLSPRTGRNTCPSRRCFPEPRAATRRMCARKATSCSPGRAFPSRPPHVGDLFAGL